MLKSYLILAYATMPVHSGMGRAPTSYEAIRIKVVNRKPMNHTEGTLVLHGGEEVRSYCSNS
ncbi:TVG0291516 [Thermoplasma volcanium GSS1]|uniref:TVG0291516 protein n=1 Tax=Thermoplasma volcanium (strain ATCC 51530 / DSM 4299 / JCM 9571 / NBRC 15438 / GSS1) TaxID=273116 RepID=Q97C27_THEVO|nr:hypothetical protein [Thermoplasma volcanium]BAB59420.1 TVG0291516 [Thermoplasma volcanium GSS1]